MADSMSSVIILMADDSEDDRLMTRDALREGMVVNEIKEVEDGEELMDYLMHRGNWADPDSSPRPGVILLDLNMPRKGGREALAEIKADPTLKRIPVVILTTSQDEEDIVRSYDLGVSSFITKPVTFDALVETMRTFGRYWIDIVTTPHIENGD